MVRKDTGRKKIALLIKHLTGCEGLEGKGEARGR